MWLRESRQDDIRSGHPSTSVTQENIDTLLQLTLNNRCFIKVDKLDGTTGISCSRKEVYIMIIYKY